MDKNLDVYTYLKLAKIKALKKWLIKFLIIGIIWFLILMLPWLFWLKPYKDFGHYEADAIYGQNIFVVGAYEEKIIYNIDGIIYEKIIKSSSTYYVQNTTKLDFYYEKDNPNYIINDRTSCLIALPCVASCGLLLSIWAIWYYVKKVKNINKQILNVYE